MEISRLKWAANHPILPGLDIKLTDDVGNIYKTIIIAGDNGLGKTTILNSIHNIVAGISCDLEAFEYYIGHDKYIATSVDAQHIRVMKDGGTFDDVELSDARKNPFDFGKFGNMDDFAPQKFTSFISTATTDFQSSSKENNVYNEIKNLLITLERQDNEAYKALNSGITTKTNLISVSEFSNNHSKLKKFKVAFNKVFDNLEFDCIKSEANDTRVLFTKGSNEEIDIDRLSTGEKQIVFRGSSLLSQAQTPDIVLVDEPEISMHPRWMGKILSFYKALVANTTTQQSQLFITTHSDLIVKKAVDDGNALIVRLTKNGQNIACNKPEDMVLPSATSAEINYVVFGICSPDYHIQLFAHLHNNITSNDKTKVQITMVDASIKGQPQFGPLYEKTYENVHLNGNKTVYETLPCYVRNCIDHPKSPDSHGNIQDYSEDDLKKSIKLLRELIIEQKQGRYDYTK